MNVYEDCTVVHAVLGEQCNAFTGRYYWVMVSVVNPGNV